MSDVTGGNAPEVGQIGAEALVRSDMEVADFARALFDGPMPSPAVAKMLTHNTLIDPETAQLLQQLCLAVTWAGIYCKFDGITVRPDPADEAVTKVRVYVRNLVAREQLKHALGVIGARIVMFTPEDSLKPNGPGDLRFHLEAPLARRLRGSA